jgi:hypothetical protein
LGATVTLERARGAAASGILRVAAVKNSGEKYLVFFAHPWYNKYLTCEGISLQGNCLRQSSTKEAAFEKIFCGAIFAKVRNFGMANRFLTPFQRQNPVFRNFGILQIADQRLFQAKQKVSRFGNATPVPGEAEAEPIWKRNACSRQSRT